jgi:hypothetical protein
MEYLLYSILERCSEVFLALISHQEINYDKIDLNKMFDYLDKNYDEHIIKEYIKNEIFTNIIDHDKCAIEIVKLISGYSDTFYGITKNSIENFDCQDEDDFFIQLLTNFEDMPEIQRFLDYHYMLFCIVRQFQ